MILSALFLSVLPAFASALYSASSPVVQLSEADFKTMLKSDELWMVEFYAPWCGHCKNLTPEWEAAAKALKGVVKVAALDGTTSQSLMQKYGVQGFPTIKIFGADKKSPVDYQGERKADAIISHALKAVTQLVSDRKGGKGSSSSKSESKKSSSGSGSKKSEVIELTDTNFNALVMESKDQWLVEFFAPWCGHCKNLAPEWEEAAKQLKGSVKLGAVDATVHSELASKYGVKGYPTIKVFPAGKKGKATDYNGPRESTGIVEYAMKLLDESGVPPEITQLTSQGSFDESCGNNRLCAILFVPHILDSGASGRNAYISMMQEVSKEFRGKPVSFVWSEGGAQADLETGLGATFGYPALVFLAKHKGAYSIMRSSWSKQNIVTFINGVMRGSEQRLKIDTVPAVRKAAAWDGKDAVLEVDEVPLDAIMSD